MQYDNHQDQHQEAQASNHQSLQKKSTRKAPATFVDNRAKTIAQRKLQETANNSPQVKKTAQLQAMADNYATQSQHSIQKKENHSMSAHGPKRINNTGLPDNLKSGIENLSGYTMDDVKVHYNSDKPAQLQAHAYAQGTDIHLGSGQEKHLPHEAWHVVQQKQGIVKPTMEMNPSTPLIANGGVNINDDKGLEKEADIMGGKALQLKSKESESQLLESGVFQKQSNSESTFQSVDNRPETNVQKKPYERTSSNVRGKSVTQQQQPIQRKLIIDNRNIAPGAMSDVSCVVNTVYQDMLSNDQVKNDKELFFYLNTNTISIKKQLTKWIENKPGSEGASKKSHPDFGRKQQNRSYASHYDLARALIGWVQAKPMRHVEKNIAEGVYQNPALQAALNGLCLKLYYKILNLGTEGVVSDDRYRIIMEELQTGLSNVKGSFNEKHLWNQDANGKQTKLGHYQRYHRKIASDDDNQHVNHGVPDNQLEILRDPTAYELKDKVIILHDLMEYFGRRQRWNPITAGQELLPGETREDTMVTTAVNKKGERINAVSMTDGKPQERQRARGMGHTTASRDEDAPSTLLARGLRLPVWAGQSMTTVRMMKLAEWVGASNMENAALAMSIFAYWRKDYDHRSDFAYHTMFEVLDVAKNFGVPYRMQSKKHVYLDINIKHVLNESRRKYYALVQSTQELAQQVNRLNIGGKLRESVKEMFQNIKKIDREVNVAYQIASSKEQTDNERSRNLNEIVILLENAAQVHRQIRATLNAIPQKNKPLLF